MLVTRASASLGRCTRIAHTTHAHLAGRALNAHAPAPPADSCNALTHHAHAAPPPAPPALQATRLGADGQERPLPLADPPRLAEPLPLAEGGGEVPRDAPLDPGKRLARGRAAPREVE